MSSVSSSGEPGRFEFLGESDLGSQADLFRPAAEEVAAARVLEALRHGPCPVRIFCEDWAQQPGDFLSGSDYRRLLVLMEEREQIEVLGEDGQTPQPRTRRRRLKGKATLSDRLWVRRRDPEGSGGG